MAIQSVKLFANGEIRRFPADGNVKYETLVQNVAQLYPQCSSVQLTWKDADNDSIAIKSDDDINEAAKYVSNGVFQIYLTSDKKREEASSVERDIGQDSQIATDQADKQPEPDQTEMEHDPTMHVGISCDGCNGVVKGLRYKCIACPNYDLCKTCHSDHLHDEHPMIRIVDPADKSWEQACVGAHFPFHFHGSPCGLNKNNQRANEPNAANASTGNDQEKAPNFGEIISNILASLGNASCHHQSKTAQENVSVPNVGEMIANVLASLSVDSQPSSENAKKDPMEKIQQAFDQMISMGFNNEDGWLKNLLQQKNGDINAILDMFKPHKN